MPCSSVNIPDKAEADRGASPRPLRVGALLDNLTPPLWIKQVLNDILSTDGLKLILIIRSKADARCDKEAANGLRGSVLFRLCTWADYILRRTEQDAFAQARVSPDEYDGVIVIGGDATIPEVDLARLGRADLDVIVNLGSMPAPVELARIAVHGVWEFTDTAPVTTSYSRNATRLWAQWRKSAVMEDELRACGPDGVERVVGKISSRNNSESIYRAHNTRCWRRSSLIIQRLCSLFDRRADVLEPMPSRSSAATESSARKAEQQSFPGNLQVSSIVVHRLAKGVRDAVRRRFKRPSWFIGIRTGLCDPLAVSDMSGFEILHAPGDRYYADPFLIEEAGKTYVFFEDFRRNELKGVISYLELPLNGGTPKRPKVALSAKYHLSYPLIFRWEGQIFMLPETSAARRIEVFKAVEFPDVWEPYSVLIDNVVGYDPTIFEYDGKFWLFVSGVWTHGGENDLFLYYANHPFGRWKPHAANPVISDSRRARPAGAMFAHDGHLYRPGQDCSVIYGRAVTLNKVELLSETAYRETPAARIDPGWLAGNVGTHTFNCLGTTQVVDGRVWRPRWHK